MKTRNSDEVTLLPVHHLILPQNPWVDSKLYMVGHPAYLTSQPNGRNRRCCFVPVGLENLLAQGSNANI